MANPKLRETAEQIRTSKFAREVLGPKVAQPLGSWLQSAFDTGDDIDGPPAARTSQPGASQPSTTQPGTTQPRVQSASETSTPPDVAPAAEVFVPEPSTRLQHAKQIALAVKDRIKEHNLIVVAAGIAFWGLLAIPALLVSVVSTGGLVFDPDTIKAEVNDKLTGAPEEVRAIIGEQLEGVAGGSTGGLITGVVLGILLALWTTSGAMAKVMGTLNTIYGVQETRKFVKLRGTAIVMTFGGIIFVLAAMFLVAALPPLLRRVDGVGDTAAMLFSLASWPLLGLVMVIGLGVLYRWGPNRSDRYQPITAGAMIATVLWILAMVGFSIYTSTAATYNETYGSLGGLVMLLLFLLITALMVLLGAEIHAAGQGGAAPATEPSRAGSPPAAAVPRQSRGPAVNTLRKG